MAGKAEILEKVGEKTRFSPENQPEKRGRHKGVPNTSTRLQRFLNATKRGKNPATGVEEEFTIAEMMDLQQIAKALKGDTSAWEKLLDRLEGKAKNPVEHSGPEGGAIPVEQTVINVQFRRPSDVPNESGAKAKPKGRKKAG